MNDISKCLAVSAASLREIIQVINAGGRGIAIVVDGDKKLVGILTDFDVRRALLQGASLDAAVEPYINRYPTVAYAATSKDELYRLMRQKRRTQVPLLDFKGRVVGLETLGSVVSEPKLQKHPVVIMAGGSGARLRPLTLNLPKPLLPIRQTPILQIILEELKRYGFAQIYVAIYYRGEQIEKRFGDGRSLGLQISYLRECKPLGTAGGLSMLPDNIEHPLIVMNGDLLTSVNFDNLVSYHMNSGEKMTMCVRRCDFEIPYGVIRLGGLRVVGVEEKPTQSFFINGGIYVLAPELLALVPKDQKFDMTDLIELVIEKWGGIGSFPVHEYWCDIGEPHAYQKAYYEYKESRE